MGVNLAYRRRWLTKGLGPLLAGLLALAGCAEPGPAAGETQTPAAAAVREPGPAAEAPPEPAPPAPGFVGVVLARETVEVVAEVDGRLEDVAVRPGSRVARGQVLAVLDTRTLAQDLAIAEASLTAAQADRARTALELAEAEQQHQRRLTLGDLVSKEDVAAARFRMQAVAQALEVVEARVAQERVRVEQLRERLGRAELRAPLRGMVALRYLDPGAVVRPGTPVVRIISAQDLLVRFAVPPEEAAALAVGQRVQVRLEALPLVLEGAVEQVAPEVDSASLTVFVEAGLEVPRDLEGQVQPGLVARVSPLPGRPARGEPA